MGVVILATRYLVLLTTVDSVKHNWRDEGRQMSIGWDVSQDNIHPLLIPSSYSGNNDYKHRENENHNQSKHTIRRHVAAT